MKIKFFAPLLLLFQHGYADEQLKSLVQMGLTNSNTLKIRSLNEDQARMTLESAKLDFIPKPQFSASTSRGTSEAWSPSGIRWEKLSNTSAGISIAYPLWDNGERFRSWTDASENLKEQQITTENEKQRYIITVIETYFKYQVLLNRKDILESKAANIKWSHEKAIELVKLGVKTRRDTIDTEIELVALEREKMELENQLQSQKSQLLFLVRGPNDLAITKSDLVKSKPYFAEKFDAEKESLTSTWEDDFENSNLELKLFKQSVISAETVAARARIDRWPEVNAEVNYDLNLSGYLQEQPDPAFAKRHHQSASAVLSLRWTPFDWGITKRKIGSLDADTQIARYNLDDVRMQKRAEFEDLLQSADALQKSLRLSELIVDKARDNYSYTKEMYNLGRVTILELRDATIKLSEAEIELADRVSQRYLVSARITAALGKSLVPR